MTKMKMPGRYLELALTSPSTTFKYFTTDSFMYVVPAVGEKLRQYSASSSVLLKKI